MKLINRTSVFIILFLYSFILLSFAQTVNNTPKNDAGSQNLDITIYVSLIGLFGVLIGSLIGLLSPLITAKADMMKWEREQLSKRDEWLRNRLEEIYGNCIEKLSNSKEDYTEARKWLSILLIYHQDRNSDDFYELYDRVMSLDTEPQIKHKFKELSSNIIEMAAVDSRLVGNGERSAAQKVFEGSFYLNKKNYNKAIQYFDDAIFLNPKYAKAWSFKGDAFFNQNEWNKAIESYKEAIRINPNYEKALISLGNALGAAQNYGDSINYFDRAININPKLPGAWFGKGLALSKEKRFTEALTCFEKAIKISPIYTEAWLEMGKTLKELGRYAEAEEAFARAKELKEREF